MDDFIICGLCSSQFYLSNYQDFLNHKISKCAAFTGNNCGGLRDYDCYHCQFSTSGAEKLINHFQDSHKLRLVKEVLVDGTTQVEDFEGIDLIVHDSKLTNISLLNEGGVQITDDHFSKTVIKRDRCCMEDPNGDYCDEMAQCPLLMETNLISPATSRDTGIQNTDYSFNSNSTISLSNKYKYGCSLCTKRFKQKVHLNKHILVKHENRRPYKCSICSYCTVEKGYLKTHMRKHTGERPYKCIVCDYQSSQNCALKVHMKRLHPDFTINCHLCGERFRTTLEYKKHEQLCQLKLDNEHHQ